MLPEKTAVATIGLDTYYTRLEVPRHTVHADEPADKGGTDRAPSPGDFLRMSLASCTAITLRMYANRKNLDLPQIQVKVTSDHTADGSVFRCEVYLTGNIEEHHRKRLLQIAAACPIHKTLKRPIEIQTHLA